MGIYLFFFLVKKDIKRSNKYIIPLLFLITLLFTFKYLSFINYPLLCISKSLLVDAIK